MKTNETGYNCWIEGEPFKVYPSSNLYYDKYGCRLDVEILRINVVDLMDLGVVPFRNEKGIYYIGIRVNNNTKLTLNGLSLSSLDPSQIEKIDFEKVDIRLCLSVYSKPKRNQPQCYATKIALTIKEIKICS